MSINARAFVLKYSLFYLWSVDCSGYLTVKRPVSRISHFSLIASWGLTCTYLCLLTSLLIVTLILPFRSVCLIALLSWKRDFPAPFLQVTGWLKSLASSFPISSAYPYGSTMDPCSCYRSYQGPPASNLIELYCLSPWSSI